MVEISEEKLGWVALWWCVVGCGEVGCCMVN
jgi:hypothetical protein